MLSGKCSPEKMIALPPAEQTRLAEALLRLPERRAGDLAVSLLSAASSRHNHPITQLALGRLYDPATFKTGGPLSAPNPGRALDLLGRAAEKHAAQLTRMPRPRHLPSQSADDSSSPGIGGGHFSTMLAEQTLPKTLDALKKRCETL